MNLIPAKDPRTVDMFSAIESALVSHQASLGSTLGELRNKIYMSAMRAVGKNYDDNEVIEAVRCTISRETYKNHLSTTEHSVLTNDVISAIVACREQYRRAPLTKRA